MTMPTADDVCWHSVNTMIPPAGCVLRLFCSCCSIFVRCYQKAHHLWFCCCVPDFSSILQSWCSVAFYIPPGVTLPLLVPFVRCYLHSVLLLLLFYIVATLVHYLHFDRYWCPFAVTLLLHFTFTLLYIYLQHHHIIIFLSYLSFSYYCVVLFVLLPLLLLLLFIRVVRFWYIYLFLFLFIIFLSFWIFDFSCSFCTFCSFI